MKSALNSTAESLYKDHRDDDRSARWEGGSHGGRYRYTRHATNTVEAFGIHFR
ncbi:MAG: hypothetical protein ACREVA_01940 [Burkholderiales bacterium]